MSAPPPTRLARLLTPGGWTPVRLVGYDAKAHRIEAELMGFVDRMAAWGTRGVVSEVAWPNSATHPDSGQWDDIFERWFGLADQAGLPVLMWSSGRVWGSDYQLTVYGSSDPGIPGSGIDTVFSQARVLERHLHPAPLLRGTNLSGPESNVDPTLTGTPAPISSGGVFSNVNAGTYGVDWVYPSAADLAFVAGRGVGIVRLPVRWERLQPVLGGPLDPAELGRITTLLAQAAAAGLVVHVLIWNMGGYFIGTDAYHSTWETIGLTAGSPVNVGHFTDLWRRLSGALHGTAGLHSYGLCNEPAPLAAGTPRGANLVPDGSFDGGGAGWSATGCTLSTSRSGARSGAACLALTATGGTTFSAQTGYDIAVTSGGQYLATAYMRAATTAQQWTCQVDWLDANRTYLGSGYGNFLLDVSSGYTESVAAVTAPAGAAIAQVKIRTNTISAAGEVHYVDDVSLVASTGNVTAAQVWQSLAQAALSAVRANGDHTEIWVAGYSGQSPVTFLTDHPMPFIADPANNFRYDVHHYTDNTSGTGGAFANSYAAEVAAAITAGY